MQYDKKGRPRGTLREMAAQYLTALHGRSEVRLRYRHSLLGAELVASGFVVASREYSFGEAADPFRLPRALREIALARRGRDMDDAASYPRACLEFFHAGKAESRVFLARPNRERIMAAVGEHFFGDGPPAAERRKWVKELFNALDNDGAVSGWKQRCAQAGHAVRADASADAARVDLGGAGVFALTAYVRSRAAMTEEFERRMPAMYRFVTDWLHARRDPRESRSGLTAKSYFLQEAEGLSRAAKVAWARRRGDLAITNLQHDGVVVVCGEEDPEEVRAAMEAACTEVLGYDQPVEEKPLGEDVSDAEQVSE